MKNFQSKFFRLLTLIYQRELQIIKKLEMTLLEYYTLQILSFSLDVTPKEIAVKLSLPKSSVTYIIDSLEKRGLVKRKLDTRDRRSWLVFLTDKGEKMLKRIFTHKSELLMPVFSKFSDDEKIYWDKFINNIIESFENKSKK